MSEPLHRMNPTHRFSQRVDDYVRYRPDYPQAAIDAIFEGMGFASLLTVADVGAGTGILSRQLAARGALVVAVEPNPEMRAACTAHERILLQDGTAEATGLKDHSVDLITCGQAFHWFDTEKALAEFRRVIRGLGRLAIMWNTRDVDDPVTTGYTAAIRKASDEHPAESRMDDVRGFEDSAYFTDLRALTFPHVQWLTLDGLIGRARSASYCPTSGPKYRTLMDELTALHARHADPKGRVALRYVTKLFLLSPALPFDSHTPV
ncbi:MAG: class I SAM-dependent methyltransferase [Phycisphaerales bacterium]